MQNKSQTYKIKGMNRDLSYSAFNPDFSYENYNIRITTTDSNSMLRVSNEKGNREITLYDIEESYTSLVGEIIGYCEIDNKLVVFTHTATVDRIYLLYDYDDGRATVKTLFEAGSLNFSSDHQIQAIPFYESEVVQKVYWIDGLNEPRFINVMAENSSYSAESFNFYSDLKLNEVVAITKEYGDGLFKSGAVQYGFSYFNTNGSETGLVFLSEPQSVSPIDRGGQPDEIIPNSFRINIDSVDSKFDFIRLYSVFRESLDGVPIVKRIADLRSKRMNSVTYIDKNIVGDTMDADILLTLYSDRIVPQCMEQKYNTLFFGNIKIKENSTLGIYNLEDLNILAPTFNWELDNNEEIIESSLTSTSYPYRPALNTRKIETPSGTKISKIAKHFKYGETYRLGLQGQNKDGSWSTPIWIGKDFTVDKRYSQEFIENHSAIKIQKVIGKLWLTQYRNWFQSNGFVKVRPLMVPLSYSDRHIIAQGIGTNTLGVMSHRVGTNKSSQVFSMPDYLVRSNGRTSPNTQFSDGTYFHFDLLKLNNVHDLSGTSMPSSKKYKFIENMGSCSENPVSGKYGEPEYYNINGTFKYSPNIDPALNFVSKFQKSSVPQDRDYFFIDNNIANLWSPEIMYDYDNINSYLTSISQIGLYGFAIMTGGNDSFSIDGTFADSLESGSGPTNRVISLANYNYTSPLLSDTTTNENFRSILLHYNFGSGVVGYASLINHMVIPIWTPGKLTLQDLKTIPGDDLFPKVTIDFSSIKKSMNVYCGYNYIVNDNRQIVYDINQPKVFYDDQTSYYKSNSYDNTLNDGNILYSKRVSKSFSASTFITARAAKYPVSGFAYISGVPASPNRAFNNSIDWSEEGFTMEYSSSPHALFSFKETNSLTHCLPTFSTNAPSLTTVPVATAQWYRGSRNGSLDKFITEIHPYSIFKNQIQVGDLNPFHPVGYNSFPIFDVIKPVTEGSQYGGKSKSALLDNQWIPCGPAVSINDECLYFSEGDTYITRFDFLKSYVDNLEAVNNVSSTMSFICESFINLDGRYDANRYRTDISVMQPTNYGLMNKAYTQKDNYFTYGIIDPDRTKANSFKSTITWTGTKRNNETTDSWTKINLINTMDLDGTYGPVNSINLVQNNLYAFQDKAIASILFKERSQLSDQLGSISLGTGYLTPEYNYLTNQYGTASKWSVVSSKSGLYFVDYENKLLANIGNGISPISTLNGFKSWFADNTDRNAPLRLSYDKANGDIHMHNETSSLAYSELLGGFTSFYEYKANLPMINAWGRFLSTKGSSLWSAFDGDYNSFYGAIKGFSIEYVTNPDPLFDKVFNNIDYRLDNDNINWNNLRLSNHYQHGELDSVKYNKSTIKKFNVYRTILPRDNFYNQKSLDRIRSTWANLKLSWTPPESNLNKLFSMQDLTLYYFI